MSNLIAFAQKELESAKLLAEEGDFYGGETGKAVLELVECFAKQGHSGMSASLVSSLFHKLSKWEPITPISGEDNEWFEYADGMYQNTRCSALFKEGKGGKPYYLDAIVWKNEDGSAFTGTVAGITSRQYVKLPFTPKSFYVLMREDENNRQVIDLSELDKVFEYYEEYK